MFDSVVIIVVVYNSLAAVKLTNYIPLLTSLRVEAGKKKARHMKNCET